MKQVLKAFLAVLVISCSSPVKEKEEGATKDDTTIVRVNNKPIPAEDYFKTAGDSMVLPSFEIQLELSEKAKKEMKNKKESIIVTAYFSGIPKDTTKYMDDGQYAVGTHSIELTGSGNAKFEGVKISKPIFETLADKDIEVLINVYSGRRSSTLNLLDCDILQKKISEIKDQKFILKGKLIKE